MLLNIITPCVRKENLIKILESLRPDLVLIRWIIVFDQDQVEISDLELCKQLQEQTTANIEMYATKKRWSVSGNAQRNAAIDLLQEGYAYFIDDDNIVHPDFWKHFLKISQTGKAFVGKQLLEDGQVRDAAGYLVKTNCIDAAQFCLPVQLIGKNRWKEDAYAADGMFIGYIYHLKYLEFTFINAVLAHYNWLGRKVLIAS